jgi:hypothetical protein
LADTPTTPVALGDAAARQLANTTKTVPQLATISPRWLVHLLQWLPVDADTYRVNKVRNPEAVKIACARRDEAKRQGVLGLFQPGLPGEQSPGLSVRFMGINRSAIASYLISLYCSLALLTDDAVGLLDDVEIGKFMDGIEPTAVGTALNQEGIAVRAGHHCAQPILRRFGHEATVLASLAFYNTCAEVDAMIAVLRRLSASSAGRRGATRQG